MRTNNETGASAYDSAYGHHEHNDGPEPASRFLQVFTVMGNGIVAAAEGVTSVAKDAGGIVVGTWSVAGDFLHNGGDFVSYWMQFNTMRNGHHLPVETVMKRRRISHALIMLSSLYVACQAGYEMFDGEIEKAYNPAAVYAATASVALNSAVFAGMKVQAKLQRDTEVSGGGSICAGKKAAEDDISKHLLAVDMPSALLALGGSWMQRQGIDMDIATYNISAEQVAAVVSGAAGAYFFRPTKKNLLHDCTGSHL